MKRKIVVSNLRMPENNWLMVKSGAAELGMSVNEYLNSLIWETSGRQQLGLSIKRIRKSSEKRFWDIYKIMEKTPYKPMGASRDDKIIYGLNK